MKKILLIIILVKFFVLVAIANANDIEPVEVVRIPDCPNRFQLSLPEAKKPKHPIVIYGSTKKVIKPYHKFKYKCKTVKTENQKDETGTFEDEFQMTELDGSPVKSLNFPKGE